MTRFRTDNMGQWYNLGNVTPILFKWVKFPRATLDFNASFRLNFTGYNPKGDSGYAWLRLSYLTNANNRKPLVEQAIRIYPKEESNIITFPYPEEFTAKFIKVYRRFEIQKMANLPRNVGIKTVNTWAINIEELVTNP